MGTIAGILPAGIVQSMRACARDIAGPSGAALLRMSVSIIFHLTAGPLWLWAIVLCSQLVDLLLPRGVCSVRFSPDGSLLVCGLIKPSGPDRDDSGTHASSTAKNKHKLEAAYVLGCRGGAPLSLFCAFVCWATARQRFAWHAQGSAFPGLVPSYSPK